ncbi:MAG: YfhO family protein [Anaerolineae bacterium]|nr:YfhO family protein [Anaerolineae bacterium]
MTQEQSTGADRIPALLKRIVSHPTFIAVVVLSLLWAVFFWRFLTPNAVDRVILDQRGDFIQHYYAFAQTQAERLWQGQLPLWDAYNHGGMPFAANIQWATWYPPRLLAIWIAGPGGFTVEAYQLEVAFHYLLCSLFCYAFFRAIVKRPGAALAGSVIFTYGGYLTGYPMMQPSIVEASIWLPLILLGVHRSINDDNGWRIAGCALAGLAIGLSILAGHPQTTLYMGYLAIAYLIFTGWQAKLPWHAILWRGALTLALGAGFSAVQLFPSIELASLSSRVADYGYMEKALGFQPGEWLTLFWPNPDGIVSPLYVGVAGLLLALGAVLRRKPVHLFWLGTAALSLMLSLGGNGAVYDFFYVLVPGFNVFRSQERAAFLFSFALAVLAVLQIDWLTGDDAQTEGDSAATLEKIAAVYLGFVGLLLIVMWYVGKLNPEKAIAGGLLNALSVVTLTAALFFGWLRWRRDAEGPTGQTAAPPWQAAALLIPILVFDLFTVGMRLVNYLPDTEQNHLQPPEILEIVQPKGRIQWHVDGAAGLQGFGPTFDIPDIYGTGPFTLETTDRLRQLPVDRFWELFSVKYVTLLDGTNPPEASNVQIMSYHTNYSGEVYVIYEALDPRPLGHLVYDYRPAGDYDYARALIAAPEVNLREMGITMGDLPIELPVERPAVSKAEAKMVTPERIEVTVSTTENALLTLAVPNYPGWQATIDGEPAQIVDTYAGLIGIPVTPGRNQYVVVEFKPSIVLIGGIVTAITLVAMIVIAVLAIIVRRRENAAA